MPMIFAYQKFINTEITRELRLPVDVDHHQLGTELVTLPNGLTYVSLPDGAVLPADQPAEIVASIQPVTLTPELIGALKKASPHCHLIYSRMQEMIRAQYSIEDEQYFARIGVGVSLGAYAFEPGEEAALLAFGAFVESVRLWGRTERAKLGL